MSGAGHPGSPPASPLENDDLLWEILLGLPPTPSSLPRASLVCKRWHRLVSNPGFLRRFRAHHRRNAPLLGFLKPGLGEISFNPILDPPDRIPRGRFSLHLDGRSRLEILSCRQGLVLIHNSTQLQLLVWDPVTGDQHRIAYPQEFFHPKGTWLNGTVLHAADGIHGGGGSSHFQVVLVGNDAELTEAIASVYSSETGEWGGIITTACPSMFAAPIPGFLDGGSVYWFLFGLPSVGVLEFDLDRQRLAVIEMPEEVSGLVSRFRIMQAVGGGLGVVRLSSSSRLELWKRKSDVDAGWERRSSVELDKLLSLSSDEPMELKCV